MKANLVLLPVLRLALGVMAALTLAVATLDAADEVLPVNITCSPSVINLASVANGDWLTVHTDIPYGLVDSLSVTLQGIAVDYVKSDNRGFLVAKFSLSVFKGLLKPPGAELTLSGLTKTGQPFAGTDSVKVIK